MSSETHEAIVLRLASQFRASMRATGDEGSGFISFIVPGDVPGRVQAIVHEGETKEEAATRAHDAAVDLWEGEASGRRFSRRWTLIEVSPGGWSVVAEGGTHFELTGPGPERVGLAEWAGRAEGAA